ncbi:UDP-N-acetylmuramate--L-alanine ligase [Candidatus Microgenomates bacterium]|nr:MAG: UDP-N-acetylmuramate--L-alanine ligase [Candidatus Microgenomates bacterium]
MNKIKSIHFIGIKGVGVAPLAIIAKEAGFKVTGSDIQEDFITDKALEKAGIKPFVNFSQENIKDVDLVITTGAHGGLNNIEAQKAKDMGIPVMTQGEAVGVFMKGEIFGRKLMGISIAGCHGKTTTTAMLATIFRESKLDPSFLVGTGEVASLGGMPAHYGKGKYFIAEADEYATEPNLDKTPKFMWQDPKIAVFTNIELDHPDFYSSVDNVRNVFLDFAGKLPNDGVLIANGDDPEIKSLLHDYKKRNITFGFSSSNDYILKRVNISFGQTFFWIETHGVDLGEFMIGVVGEHNALNATGAIIASLECGIPLEKIKKALKEFSGTKRRFEYIGKLSKGALLFDDYAHHPTEIKKTLKAFTQNYPKSKIVCVFQPHTYSRTKKLFEHFLHSFNDSNTVIITNIYASLREDPDLTISSEKLAEGISRFHGNVLFLPKLSDVVEYIKQKEYGKDTVVVMMGAGDVYKLSKSLITNQ